MSLTLFLAQLFGILLLIISIVMVFRRQEMLRVVEDFLKDRASLFLGGFIALAGGLMIVLTHNIWTGTLLTVLITIIGWLLVIRGILWFFMPAGSLRKIFGSLKKEQTYYIITVIIFIVGIYLAYTGFTG